MLYRRRFDPVEAVQFRKDVKPWPDGVVETKYGWHTYPAENETPCRIDDGDWIVTYKNGVKLRIKDALFLKSYEPVPT